MGVKRLKKYFQSNRLISKTNLKEAADTWRASGGQPILIVDTLNFMNHIAKNSETLCCGGEYPLVEERLLYVIQSLRDIGIELIFVLDGRLQEVRIDIWKERRMRKLILFHEGFQKLELCKVKGFADYEIFANLAPDIAKEVAKAHSKVLVTNIDPDLAMVQYVMEKKCLGIVSEDTDFIVFDGIPHLFLPHDFAEACCANLRSGNKFDPQVAEYERSRFIVSIGLEPKAFPILATLMGNDFIDYNQCIAYLKNRFGASYLDQIIRNIASLANQIYQGSSGDNEVAALRLAEEIFHEDSLKTKKIMLDSLNSYDWRLAGAEEKTSVPKLDNEDWNNLVERLIKSGELGASTASIVVNQRFQQSERFEDQKRPCGALLSDFRRRNYGVLLHENVDRHLVEEYVATHQSCFDRRNLVSKIQVDVHHPGLWSLLTGGQELDNARWDLVWWVLCPPGTVPHDTFTNIKSFPDELKLIALTILYLYRILEEISEHEASVIMLMVCTLMEYSYDKLTQFSMVNEMTTKRAVSLAALYQTTYGGMKWCAVSTCGLKINYKTSVCYSGYFFHWLMKFKDIEALRHRLLPQVWNRYDRFKEDFQKLL